MAKREASKEVLLDRRRYNILFVVCLAALLVFAGFVLLMAHAATPVQPDVSGQLAFGFNGSGDGQIWCFPYGCGFTESYKRLDDAKAMGVKWIRLDETWQSIETTNNPSNPSAWNFYGFDDAVKGSIARGITPVLDLNGTPDWTKGMTMQQRADAYGAFAKGVAQHYKALGTGGEVKYFELGNEEDLPSEWTLSDGKTKVVTATQYPEQVARKEHSAWAAIKGVDTSYMVISNGLGTQGDIQPTDVPATPDAWAAPNFLRAFYAEIKTLGYNSDQMFDAVGYHPYCDPNSYPVRFSKVTAPGHYCPYYWMTADTSSNNVFTIMANNGDSEKRVWATEVGVSTGDLSAQIQSDSLTDAYTYIQQHASKFGPLFWYMYKDSSGNTSDHFANYGIRTWGGSATAEGTPKMAYNVYKYIAAASGGGSVKGDLNGDGTVNTLDLDILKANFGKTGATAAQGDLNGDGKVNIIDLSIMAGNWGK